MKKIILVTAIFCGLFQAQAQKANIQSAISYLKDNDFENAKKMIDEATKSESTKSNAKAWFLKGVIYQAIGTPASDQMPFIQFKSTTAMGDEAGIPVMLEGANKFAAQHPDAIDLALERIEKPWSLILNMIRKNIFSCYKVWLMVNLITGHQK